MHNLLLHDMKLNQSLHFQSNRNSCSRLHMHHLLLRMTLLPQNLGMKMHRCSLICLAFNLEVMHIYTSGKWGNSNLVTLTYNCHPVLIRTWIHPDTRHTGYQIWTLEVGTYLKSTEQHFFARDSLSERLTFHIGTTFITYAWVWCDKSIFKSFTPTR